MICLLCVSAGGQGDDARVIRGRRGAGGQSGGRGVQARGSQPPHARRSVVAQAARLHAAGGRSRRGHGVGRQPPEQGLPQSGVTGRPLATGPAV